MSNVSADSVTIYNCKNRSAKPLLQGNHSKLIEDFHALEKLSDELREMEKTLSQLLSNRKEEEKPGYWTRVARRVNRVFFIVYVSVVSLFLIFIFSEWSST